MYMDQPLLVDLLALQLLIGNTESWNLEQVGPVL